MTEYIVLFRHTGSIIYLDTVEADNASDAVTDVASGWVHERSATDIELLAVATEDTAEFTDEEVRDMVRMD